MLSSREKLLLALLAVAVLGAGGFMGTRALQGYQQTLAARLDAREAALKQVRALRAEWTRLSRLPRARPLRQPLIGYVERLARREGLGERIQLNRIPLEQEDLESVELTVDALTLDEALKLLYAVENSDPPLVIQQLELTPAYRSKELLRVTMRILAQK